MASSFQGPVDLIVFGKSKSETESAKELNSKLSLLEYALSVQEKAVREIHFHQPMLGLPDGELKGEADGQGRMELDEEEEDDEEETQPSSEDDDAFVEVASSSEEGGSVRSNSF